MIIDVNASLGSFAFRRLRHNTSDGLLHLMDSRKIDKAIVASASAITYRNPQAGNEEAHDETRRHRDRLVPFGVINPDVRRLGRRSASLPGRLRHARSEALSEMAQLHALRRAMS